jgi:two-component system, chemotaxis family, chemotaxis protein CheY
MSIYQQIENNLMPKYKILVIDDAKYIFKAIKFALEPHGFEIVGHAENGKIGLDMYDLYQPDIVTLDITMPVMDGIETATNLVKKAIKPRIIMMSAICDDVLTQSARDIGVKFFLAKPFKPDDLVAKIIECLAN